MDKPAQTIPGQGPRPSGNEPPYADGIESRKRRMFEKRQGPIANVPHFDVLTGCPVHDAPSWKDRYSTRSHGLLG